MTAETPATEEAEGHAGLYVSDKEISRRLGFCEKTGGTIIRRLDRGALGMRPYPQKDPAFAGRRFWPAVLQWHLDYHGCRKGEAIASAPMWQENFDEPAPKARELERARSKLATA